MPLCRAQTFEIWPRVISHMHYLGVGLDNPHSNPATWLPIKAWDELCRLDGIAEFAGIRQKFPAYKIQWKEMYDSAEPQHHTLPGDWKSLEQFHKMMILRCVRPDKVNILNVCLWVVYYDFTSYSVEVKTSFLYFTDDPCHTRFYC